MKKIFTLFAAVVCGLALNAKTIYLTPGVWADGNAVIFVHSWTGADGNVQDLQMTTASGSILSVNIPDGNEKIIFVRMPAGSTALDWNTKWDQTSDLDIPSDKDMYVITDWHEGHWAVYGQGGGDNPGGQGGETPNAYWYWKGQVDGGPIENEAGGYNIFVGGISSIAVDEAAYIFVIYQEKGVQGIQYMTDGWKGMEITHVTMGACGDCPNGNKLYIPAGDYTLYLYDNGDGTVELSREELAGKTLVGGGEQAIEHTKVTEKAYKQIINGQLRIIRGDKMYDATGKEL